MTSASSVVRVETRRENPTIDRFAADDREAINRSIRGECARVPCQGLDLGRVLTKRPPLSDFAFRRTPIFRVDKALVVITHPKVSHKTMPAQRLCFCDAITHLKSKP